MGENKAFYKISERVVYAHVLDVPVLAMTREPFCREGIAACVLNETGQFIWVRLQERNTGEEILQKAVDAFEGEPERIRQEVKEFLRFLEEQGIITK